MSSLVGPGCPEAAAGSVFKLAGGAASLRLLRIEDSKTSSGSDSEFELVADPARTIPSLSLRVGSLTVKPIQVRNVVNY